MMTTPRHLMMATTPIRCCHNVRKIYKVDEIEAKKPKKKKVVEPEVVSDCDDENEDWMKSLMPVGV